MFPFHIDASHWHICQLHKLAIKFFLCVYCSFYDVNVATSTSQCSTFRKWCQHPINGNVVFVTIACSGKDVMSSTCYDFAAVLSTSYVSDNFISDYPKLILNCLKEKLSFFIHLCLHNSQNMGPWPDFSTTLIWITTITFSGIFIFHPRSTGSCGITSRQMAVNSFVWMHWECKQM